MCGIIGYVGPLQARDVVLDGLTQLEYRGYDSAGMALLTEEGIYLRKKVGQVSALRSICTEDVDSHCGIGHTRWATHGEPSEVNAHPHVSDNGNVAAVHNVFADSNLLFVLLSGV